MRTKKVLYIVVAMVLLASAMPLAITPAAAYETKIPFAGEDNELTKDELVNVAILPYMLGEGDLKLDDVGDASYVYAYWNGNTRTITDTENREVTFCRPLERLITNSPDNTRLAIAIGAGDKIVGAGRFAGGSRLCPCRTVTTAAGKKVCVEGCMNCVHTILDGRVPDMTETRTRRIRYYEVMASLRPDIILAESIIYIEDYEDKIDCPGVVAGIGPGGSAYAEYYYEGGLYGRIEVVGEVLERGDEAQELIDFVESKVDMVRSVTEALNESEKPTVYFAPRGCTKGFYDPKEGRDFTRTVSLYEPLDIAGGINVAKDEPFGDLNVGIEQLIAWEPDYIFTGCSSPDTADSIDFILTSEELQSIPAVHNGNVYNCFYPHSAGRPPDRSLFNVIYMAKVLHPDEFADLDLEKECNEIFEAFLGVDGVFTEYADYIVWPREYLEAQQ